MVPVLRQFSDNRVDFKIIATGQNSIVGSELLNLAKVNKVDIVLNTKSIKQTAVGLFLWFIETILRGAFVLRKELKLERNVETRYMIVHGDTVSTAMGAMLGKIFGMKVVHIEAGLRSFNLLSPFPEEIDRLITSKLTNIHFCPNDWALGNLQKVGGKKINTKQNTLSESLELALKQDGIPDALKKIGFGNFFIFVMHRQENLINTDLVNYLVEKVIETSEQLKCMFILHAPTELTLEKMHLLEKVKSTKNIYAFNRLPYVDFMKSINACEFLITDGGSNQEESSYFGKPCLILRKHTERIEGLNSNVVLSMNDPVKIEEFIKNYQKYIRSPISFSEKPSSIILKYLIS